MSRFSETLRRIRFERHMTQEEFAKLLNTTKQNISRYESGAVSPKISTAQAIADKLGLTLSEMNGEETPLTRPAAQSCQRLHPGHNAVQRVPKIGAVAAGKPIYDPEEYGVYVNSPVKCDAAVDMRGDSMIPGYMDGDLVFVRQQPDVPNGQVAIVFLDDEAIIKRVYHDRDGLTLLSDNPAYEPIRATAAEYDYISIFGIPVGFTRMYKKDPLQMVRKGFR